MGKKSKRANRVQNRAVAAAAAPVVTNPGCLHGAAPLANDPVAQAHQEALDSIIQSIPIGISRGGSFSSSLTRVLEYMDGLGIMNEQMLQRTIAGGVEKRLSPSSKQRNLASLHVHVAITMEYWLRVGKDEFLRVLHAPPEDVRMRRNHPWFAEWSDAGMKIVTDRDVIRYLAKHCPCDCLQAEKEQHKHDPKNKWCHKCSKLDLDENLLVCGKCQIVRYCSVKVRVCVVGCCEYVRLNKAYMSSLFQKFIYCFSFSVSKRIGKRTFRSARASPPKTTVNHC